MDFIKNYVGKVVKVQFTSLGKPTSRTGVVFQQDNGPSSVKLHMILTTGAEWEPTFREGEDLTISSVRIDKDLRAALEKVCDAKIKHKAFLDKFWKEKSMHETNVANSLKELKECSDGDEIRTQKPSLNERIAGARKKTTMTDNGERTPSKDNIQK